MDSGGRDMRFALEKLRLPAEEVRAVLLTHWHNDHAAGGQALHEQLGAAVYYHSADAPFLTRATARHGLRGWLSDFIPEWGLFVLFKGLVGGATPRAADQECSQPVSGNGSLYRSRRTLATPWMNPPLTSSGASSPTNSFPPTTP
jgi:anti-sigma factor RsiW